MVVCCTATYEADAVRVVPVVFLVAVGVEVSCEDEIGELSAAGGWFGVLALYAVEVAPEDAWVALFAEEDERVGEGFEEAFDVCCYCLTWLGVVVHDYCYCLLGAGLDEAFVKDGT